MMMHMKMALAILATLFNLVSPPTPAPPNAYPAQGCWVDPFPFAAADFNTLSPCVKAAGTVVWTSGDKVAANHGFDVWIVPDAASQYLLDCSGQPGCIPTTELELVVRQDCLGQMPGQTAPCLPIGAIGVPSMAIPADLGNHLPALGTRVAVVGIWIYNKAHDRTEIQPVEAICFWTSTTPAICGSTLSASTQARRGSLRNGRRPRG